MQSAAIFPFKVLSQRSAQQWTEKEKKLKYICMACKGTLQ
jgi:hypothetical protein